MLRSLFAVGLISLAVSSPAFAAPITINDTYYGAGATDPIYSNVDVIGELDKFEVSKIQVEFVGGEVQVSIFSSFLDNVGTSDIDMGDLFISTNGWNPFGSAPYNNDNVTNGEQWEYGVVLDRTKPTPGQVLNMLGQSGAASLYQLPSPAAYTLSSANGHHRTNQEVQVNAVGLQPVAAATWSIEDIAGDDIDKLVIKFAIAGLSGLTNDLGFRWQMTCANDIIEGQASLPEPLTLGLLSVGFAGLLSRRSIKDS